MGGWRRQSRDDGIEAFRNENEAGLCVGFQPFVCWQLYIWAFGLGWYLAGLGPECRDKRSLRR